MNNFKEHEPYNDTKIQIEDLGAPDRGIDFVLFLLGRKFHTAIHFLRAPIAFLCMGILILFFLPGAALINSTAPVSQPVRTVVQQNGACDTSFGTPRGAVWQTHSSATGSSKVVIAYVCGNMQLIEVGKP